MRQISFSEATLEAMSEEMERDESVFVMGEDLARRHPGAEFDHVQ